MKTNEFEEKVKVHSKLFDDLFKNILGDICDFVKENPEYNKWELSKVNDFCCNLKSSSVWIQDRINWNLHNKIKSF